jgi:ABC-2 type transport system ATP-binding protein
MTEHRPAIVAAGLTKRYGVAHALRGLDLAVGEGTILGVLGPNGAGKTTTVRILTTLLRPDAGRAEVAGFDVVRQPEEVRARIGLTGQYAALDKYLSGRENLEMIGRLYHLPGRHARWQAAELLARFDLSDAASRLVKTYSGGMRRRLDLAASLLDALPILFLDEPTTGLDPRSRLAVWEIVRELVADGTTLLLTTQYLEEADQLASRIAVVDRGRVIAEGTADELKARVGGERLELVVAYGGDLAAATRTLAPYSAGVVQTDPDRRTLTVPVRDGARLLAAAVRALDEAGVPVDDLSLRRPTLDDVFLALTGHVAESTTAAVTDPQRGSAHAGHTMTTTKEATA